MMWKKVVWGTKSLLLYTFSNSFSTLWKLSQPHKTQEFLVAFSQPWEDMRMKACEHSSCNGNSWWCVYWRCALQDSWVSHVGPDLLVPSESLWICCPEDPTGDHSPTTLSAAQSLSFTVKIFFRTSPSSLRPISKKPIGWKDNSKCIFWSSPERKSKQKEFLSFTISQIEFG